MKTIKYLIIVLAILITSCATLPPQNPINEKSSIIGISLEIKRTLFPPTPYKVFFIKLNETENSYLSNNEIIESNYYKDGRYYLLNAEPGRYIAIAAFEKQVSTNNSPYKSSTSTTYHVFYLPIDVIQLTDVKIQRGDVVFMGNYIVEWPFELNYGIDNPDKAQYYYCKRLQPNQAEATISGCLLESVFSIFLNTDEAAHAVRLKDKDKDNKAEIKFWSQTIKDFEGSSSQKKKYSDVVEKNKIWINIIETHINKIAEN